MTSRDLFQTFFKKYMFSTIHIRNASINICTKWLSAESHSKIFYICFFFMTYLSPVNVKNFPQAKSKVLDCEPMVYQYFIQENSPSCHLDIKVAKTSVRIKMEE